MPNRDTKKIIKWSLLGFILGLIAANFIVDQRSALPAPALPIISTIQPFALTNQHGAVITHSDLKGEPWLADIIFTRCPTVCPRMTQTLAQLRAQLHEPVRCVSLTTDPTHDTPSVMKSFAEANGGNSGITGNWHFLTGPKADLMRLAVDDLKLISVPKDKAKRDNPNDLFVHSSYIMLVDARGQLRGKFEFDATNLFQQVEIALTRLKQENDR